MAKREWTPPCTSALLTPSQNLSQYTTWTADIFSSQPLHGSTESLGFLHHFASSQSFLADSNAPQEGSQTCPSIGLAQVVDHVNTIIDPQDRIVTVNVTEPPGLFVDVAAKQLTGPIRHVRRMVHAAPTTCQWQYLGMPICGEDITRESVPAHLATHGIHKMHKDRVVQCCWQGCGSFVKRESMTRHCREVHLRLKRKSPKFDVFRWDAFVIDVF
ncbi:hypothetical protein JVU11DRAFT_7599 [Chiua virens]|nr:hypothetical protein JVU11DRAFT_7599 [Chiua virens]